LYGCGGTKYKAYSYTGVPCRNKRLNLFLGRRFLGSANSYIGLQIATMIQQHEFSLSPYKRGFHLITDEVLKQLPKFPQTGILHLYIKHTSAGLTINENASADVWRDMDASFNQLVKENEPYYTHNEEGSDDMPAHVKSSLVGSSVSIPITAHRLNLGTWQGIFLCEFRNKGGSRKLVATIIS
jgi:secondary thiamine-phosphate synthase enzyme